MSEDTRTGEGRGRREPQALQDLTGLVIVHGGQRHELAREPLYFGRDAQNTVQLLSVKASRRHAVIYRRGNHYVVRDLHSLNGVELNGKAVRQTRVQPGDELDFDEEKVGIEAGAARVGGYQDQGIVVFVDVARSAALVERYGEPMVKQLREIMDRLEDQVLLHQGCPIKNMGAGLLAVFGLWPVEDRRHSTADAALAFARHATTTIPQEVYEFLNGEGSCNVRVGMAQGELRSYLDEDLDVAGDTVTLAKHLEAANKRYGTRVLLNGPLYEALRERSHLRELDTVRLAGLQAPTTLYAFDERSMMRESASTLVRHQQALTAPLEYLRLYQQGLAAYRAGDFARAFEALDESVGVYRDAPSRCLRERVVQIMKLKGEGQLGDWDGVWSLESY